MVVPRPPGASSRPAERPLASGHRPQGSTSGASRRQATLRALGRARAGAGVALATIALTVAALTIADDTSQRWLLHVRDVARLTRTVLLLAVDEETGLRGYLLTRDTVSLAPDLAARRALGPTLDSLATATAAEPAQHARVLGIRDAVARWDRLYRTPLLAAGGARAGARALPPAAEQQGTPLFDVVRARIASFLAAQEALYAARVRHDRLIRWGALGAVVVEVLVLLGLLSRVGREARRQTGTVFDQQDRLETQAVDLEEQAMILEEQAVELETQTEELVAANRALTEALAAAHASEARFRSVVETATDAIITTDATGRILFWNAAAEQVYGYAVAEALGASLAMLIPEARRPAHVAEFARLAAGRAPQLTSGPVTRDALRKDGRVIPVELAVSRWALDGETFITSVVRDISGRMALEARLAHQASHDALTGLANRTRFREHVAAALAHDPGRPEHVAVLFFDLDDFKSVNDTAGHAAGDRLLAAVVERLLDATRGGDIVARLGGDEFGVLLWPVEDTAAVDAVAARLVAAMRRPIALDDREIVVGASIGIARGAPDQDVDALLRNADTAMYAAKDAGKGGYAWFAPAMHAALLERTQIQQDLGPALERGEFWLAYQPIVALDTGRAEGVEALVRWTHPRRGPLSPAAFIPVAEASGQIVSLGCWVLGEACRTVVGLPGTSYVTVNISGRQLGDPALVGDVAAALCESGLAPERLILEITETVLMADTAGTLERLRELKALGVRLVIDDFGTGYSSLRYLQRFPVDVLKVDKSFVDRVDGDDHDAALVRTIVALADMLGLTTVAEGIERAAQRATLAALGCALGQGYHFARPLDATSIAALLGAAASTPSRSGAHAAAEGSGASPEPLP